MSSCLPVRWVLGSELWSSGLHNKCFIHQAIYQPQEKSLELFFFNNLLFSPINLHPHDPSPTELQRKEGDLLVLRSHNSSFSFGSLCLGWELLPVAKLLGPLCDRAGTGCFHSCAVPQPLSCLSVRPSLGTLGLLVKRGSESVAIALLRVFSELTCLSPSPRGL